MRPRETHGQTKLMRKRVYVIGGQRTSAMENGGGLLDFTQPSYDALDDGDQDGDKDKDDDDDDDDVDKINKVTARQQNGAAGLCPC